jgi:hypothetical protein
VLCKYVNIQCNYIFLISELSDECAVYVLQSLSGTLVIKYKFFDSVVPAFCSLGEAVPDCSVNDHINLR